MRTLLHFSDLRFSRSRTEMHEALAVLIQNLQPDLIVVNGGLTKSANSSQMECAKAFIDSLPGPTLVLPGPSDFHWLNYFSRFQTYRRVFQGTSIIRFADRELAVFGMENENLGSNIDWVKLEKFFDSVERSAVRAVACRDLDHETMDRLVTKRLQTIGIDLVLTSAPQSPATSHLSGSVYGGFPLFVQSGRYTDDIDHSEVWGFHVVRTAALEIRTEVFFWSAKARNFQMTEASPIVSDLARLPAAV